MANDNSAAGLVPEEAVSFIKEQEGFSASAFADYAQTSIGYGTRARPGERTITREAADARLRSELAGHAVRVDQAITQSGLALTANQRAALISFDFNTGQGAYLIRTSRSVEEIAARLPTWNKVTEGGRKVVSSGLVHRRAAELALFHV
jgi:GH24 family phage-related lysozyme (muramidase)